METEILSITIITAQGVKVYNVNDVLINGGVVNSIKVADLHFQGDPYAHYVGYDVHGKMLFSVNCYCPCDVIYK